MARLALFEESAAFFVYGRSIRLDCCAADAWPVWARMGRATFGVRRAQALLNRCALLSKSQGGKCGLRSSADQDPVEVTGKMTTKKKPPPTSDNVRYVRLVSKTAGF